MTAWLAAPKKLSPSDPNRLWQSTKEMEWAVVLGMYPIEEVRVLEGGVVWVAVGESFEVQVFKGGVGEVLSTFQ